MKGRIRPDPQKVLKARNRFFWRVRSGVCSYRSFIKVKLIFRLFLTISITEYLTKKNRWPYFQNLDLLINNRMRHYNDSADLYFENSP